MRRRGTLRLALQAVAFGAVYLLLTEVARRLWVNPKHVVTFWPPGGVHLGLLLCLSPRRWPPFVLAAGVANLIADRYLLPNPPGLLTALGFAAANAVEGVAGAALVRWAVGPPAVHPRLPDVLGLTLLGGVAGPAVGATVGTAVVMLAYAPHATAAGTWPYWWVGNLVGAVVFAPLVLGLRAALADRRRTTPLRAAEAAAMLAAVTLTAVVAFGGLHPAAGFGFVVFPALLWPALRFGVGGVAAAVVPVAVVAARATAVGVGPFARPDLSPEHRAVLVQAFVWSSAVPFLVLAVLMRERRDALAGLRAANADLEDRVRRRTDDLARANDALDRQRRLFEDMAQATPDILFLHDLQTGRNVYANPQISRVLGYPPERLLAMGGGVVPALIHPDDLAAVRDRLGELARSPDGRVVESEFRARAADGSYRWLRCRTVVFSRQPDGLAHLALGIGRDVTDRKHALQALAASEARYRAVFDQAAVGIAVWRPAGEFLSVNPGFLALVGYTPEELVELAADAVVHPGDRPSARVACDRVLAGELPSATVEVRLVHRDGRPVPVRLTLSAARDRADAPPSVVGVVTPATDPLRPAAVAGGDAE